MSTEFDLGNVEGFKLVESGAVGELMYFHRIPGKVTIMLSLAEDMTMEDIKALRDSLDYIIDCNTICTKAELEEVNVIK